MVKKLSLLSIALAACLVTAAPVQTVDKNKLEKAVYFGSLKKRDGEFIDVDDSLGIVLGVADDVLNKRALVKKRDNGNLGKKVGDIVQGALDINNNKRAISFDHLPEHLVKRDIPFGPGTTNQ